VSAKVKWRHHFPDSWKFIPSKRLFPESKLRAAAEDEQLTASQDWGVIPQKEFIKRAGRRVVEINQHLDMRKRVERNDFVISMRSFEGGLERAWAEGGIRSSYVVLKPSPEAQVGYFARLFKCEQYIRALQATAHFIRDGQDLSYQDFSLVDLPLPPKDEQTQIARFLDYEIARIDALIDKQRQLIALLKEKRQAVISHAVTKGLNPDAPLRDSGVEWLGMVPAHWEVLKGSWLGQLFGSESVPEEYVLEEGSLLFIKVSSLAVDGFSLSDCRFFVSPRFSGAVTARAGFIVFPKRGAAIFTNKVNIVHGPAVVDPNLMGWIPNRRAKAEFLAHVLKLRGLAEIADVSTVPQINNKHIAPMMFPVPPRVEQAAILEYLGKRLTVLDQLTAKGEEQINLLQERRTALISAAVTGKIDVRGWKPPESTVEQDVA
jgi:type I restriction enzyme S subunit